MVKKRIAYIDYWSLQSTNSGDFLREMLLEKLEIVNFLWKTNEKFKNKKIIWAFMYDVLNFRNFFNKYLN